MERNPEVRRAIIVPFACDLIDKGKELGTESKSHCRKAGGIFFNLRGGGVIASIVVSAGLSPNKKSYPEQTLSMADMMKKELLKLGVPETNIRPAYDDEEAWGTETELGFAFGVRNTLATNLNRSKKNIRIHVVTSWYHVIRVKVLASLIWGEKVEVYSTPGSLRNALVELIKLPIQIILILFRSA